MMGLTNLGIFHTAVGLVAVLCGFIALIRDKEISPNNRLASITTEPFRASEHYVGWSEKRDKWAPSGFAR